MDIHNGSRAYGTCGVGNMLYFKPQKVWILGVK